jgi:hypothetical protein
VCLLFFRGLGHLGKDLIPEGLNIILFLAPSLAMPIGVFAQARSAPNLLDLTFDHRRNVMAQEQATARAVVVYQIADANRISFHLLLQLWGM